MFTNNALDNPDQISKGDLVVGRGSGLRPSILSVGTDSFVLIADSSQTTGMKWASINPNVGFLAYRSTATIAVTGNGVPYPVVYNTELFDLGSNYSTITGLFTAPNTATYQFNCTGNLAYNALISSQGQMTFDLSINGGTTLYRGVDMVIQLGSSFSVVGGTIQITIQLTAGDTVQPIITASGESLSYFVRGMEGNYRLNFFSGYQVA